MRSLAAASAACDEGKCILKRASCRGIRFSPLTTSAGRVSPICLHASLAKRFSAILPIERVEICRLRSFSVNG